MATPKPQGLYPGILVCNNIILKWNPTTRHHTTTSLFLRMQRLPKVERLRWLLLDTTTPMLILPPVYSSQACNRRLKEGTCHLSQ